MATYSGSTLKVNGAVSNARNSNGTLYTGPASGYAIVQVSVADFAADNTVYFTVDSRTAGYIITKAAGSTSGGSATTLTLYIGPSQVLACSSLGGSFSASVSGVEFVNN